MISAAVTRGTLVLEDVEDQLLRRWPETRIAPSLERIEMLTARLGNPHRAYRSIHLTGTNGKTSTARMVEALLAASGERTGRFTSPHLTSITERIGIAEDIIGQAALVSAYEAVAEQAAAVDAATGHPLSFFEMTVAMAYQAFARAAVRTAVVEVGMGGRWDATNVIDADVAVLLPIAIDHTDHLGATETAIATEKAGIIKPGSVAVSARQDAGVEEVLRARAEEVGARLVVEGHEFALTERRLVDGAQVISVRGLHGSYDDVHLALHGRHQAENAACAIAAVEALLGGQLDLGVVRTALERVTSPGRFEVHPGTPPVILDVAHNPHGAAALAGSLAELAPSRTIAVVAAMADKDVEEVLRTLEPVVDVVVCTRNSSPRSMPAQELAVLARTIFGTSRVDTASSVASALESARAIAVADADRDATVLVTGSVVTVGDASRVIRAPASADAAPGRAPRTTDGTAPPG